MNQPPEAFAFYGSDYDPRSNDHFQQESFANLGEAIDYARGLLARWKCAAVEVVATKELAAVVTAEEVITGDALQRRPVLSEGDLWEVSFHGSGETSAENRQTGPFRLSSWEEVVRQAQSLRNQWDAAYVDVLDGRQNLLARVAHEGAFLPDDGEDAASMFPEYDFYASDCNLADPAKTRLEMGLVFDDLDEAIEYARELLSGWACEHIDIYQDDELIAQVTPEGVLTGMDFALRENPE